MKTTHERFDEEFEGLWLDGMNDYNNDTDYTERETIAKIKAFIDQAEALAVAEERKRIVEIIEDRKEELQFEHKQNPDDHTETRMYECKKLINLITKEQ